MFKIQLTNYVPIFWIAQQIIEIFKIEQQTWNIILSYFWFQDQNTLVVHKKETHEIILHYNEENIYLSLIG